MCVRATAGGVLGLQHILHGVVRDVTGLTHFGAGLNLPKLSLEPSVSSGNST